MIDCFFVDNNKKKSPAVSAEEERQASTGADYFRFPTKEESLRKKKEKKGTKTEPFAFSLQTTFELTFLLLFLIQITKRHEKRREGEEKQKETKSLFFVFLPLVSFTVVVFVLLSLCEKGRKLR